MVDLRQASGVGHRPTLDEVPAAIAARIAGLEARATSAEALLETARKVLEPFAALAGKPIRFVAEGSVRATVDTERFGQAASFLSSLSHQDEQG